MTTIPVRTYMFEFDMRFQQYSHHLRSGPHDPQPYGLSYQAMKTPSSFAFDPFVRLWSAQEGMTSAVELKTDKRLVETYAIMAKSFMNYAELTRITEALLTDMIPKGHEAQYAHMITAHGMLLVAENWRGVHEVHGDRAVAVAVIPSGLSAHERLASMAELSKVISDTIRHQEQGSGSDLDVPQITMVTP